MDQSTHTRQALAGLAIASVLTVAGWALQERSNPPAEDDHSRVMVVGLRGSSWETLLDLTNKGRTPLLASLIKEHSVGADIISSGYNSSGEVLASLITGKFTSKHGVHSFSDAARFHEKSDPGRTPVWELLSLNGARVGVVGFPFWAPIDHGGTWIVPDWTTLSRDWLVYEAGKPIDVRKVWSDLIVKPERVPITTVRTVSRTRELTARVEQALREELAADQTLTAFALELYRTVPDSHVFLYLEGLNRFERRLDGVEPDLRRDLVKGYHETIDRLIAALSANDDGQTTFLLFSEEGNAGGGRITYRRRFPKLDRWPPIGWLVAWGRGIKTGGDPLIVSPVDLASTLLYITGQPIPNSMDGGIRLELLNENYFHKHRVLFEPL